MTNKKRYYPNKLKQLRAVPAEYFESIEFDDFMDWKIAGWRIPNEVLCIIREEDEETGKVIEYVYKRADAAKAKAREIMDKNHVFTVCTNDNVHFMKPEEEGYYDEDY